MVNGHADLHPDLIIVVQIDSPQHVSQVLVGHINVNAVHLGAVFLWHPKLVQQALRAVIYVIDRSKRDLIFVATGMHGASADNKGRTRLEVYALVLLEL